MLSKPVLVTSKSCRGGIIKKLGAKRGEEIRGCRQAKSIVVGGIKPNSARYLLCKRFVGGDDRS